MMDTTDHRASGEYEARFREAFAPNADGFGEWEYRAKIEASRRLRRDSQGRERYAGPEWEAYMETSTAGYRLRDAWTRRWAWAIPTVAALEAIVEVAPIVEIGAGTGYWTMLLREHGADVQAYEPHPIYGNPYKHRSAYAAIAKGDHRRALRHYPERTPMLCWPPYAEPMATEVLQRTRAEHVVWVGEIHGCNGDTAAMELLGHDAWREDDDPPPLPAMYELEREIEIPTWPGMHDAVHIYRRIPLRPIV